MRFFTLKTLLLLSLSSLFFSCKDKSVEFNISEEFLDFEILSSKTITFSSSSSWVASSSESWLNLSQVQGEAGDNMLIIFASENEESITRKGFISILAGGKNTQITVTQNPNKLLNTLTITLKETGALKTRIDSLSILKEKITEITIRGGVGLNESDFDALSIFVNMSRLDISKTSTLEIPDEQFRHNIKLKWINLPKGLTTIGAFSFYASGLTSIIIPKSVRIWSVDTEQNNAAFSSCKKLKKVTLTDGLSSIGSLAFRESGITFVTIPNTIAVWQQNKLRRNSAFASCTNLKQIVLTEGLSVMGANTFFNSNIETLVIPKSIKKWQSNNEENNGAFADCSNLINVMLPEGLMSLGTNTFNNSGLTSVTIPSTITVMGKGIFSECSDLKTISLPEGLTTIGIGAFYNSGLTSVIIPSSVILWKEDNNGQNSAFSNCSFLITATLSKGLTTIGSYAFENSGLTSINVPLGVIKIGDKVFAQCSDLETVSLPASLDSMGYYMFNYCSKLSIINIWATKPPVIKSDDDGVFSLGAEIGSSSVSGGFNISVPSEEIKGIYKANETWGKYKYTIMVAPK